MSSDFFMFDEPFYQHSDQTRFLPESNPFPVLSDSNIDTILQEMEITDSQNTSNFNQLTQTHFSNLPTSSDFSTGYVDYPVSAIKTEEEPRVFGSSFPSYSHGSHSYEGEKPFFAFQPSFDALFESSAFQCDHQNSFSNAQIRRVCSTGDLPKVWDNQNSAQGESSATTLMEESNFKVGRYSADERKERIDRYRAKRNQRNFSKTIKYACRKTLADSRPRVRGRFARNDELGEMPKIAPCSNRYEDEGDILVYNCQEEEDVEIVGCGGGIGDNDGGSAGGCGGVAGGRTRGQYINYHLGASSELHQYLE